MIVASVSTVYDPAGRVTAINTNAFYAPSFSNYYDAVGNRIGVVESNGNSVSFSYDGSYQLINEVRTGTNPYNISYTFDPLGNRLLQNASGQITTRTFNAANEMLTSMASSGVITSRTYDATGNLTLSNTGGALTTFTWNGDNRLLSCTKPSLTETYTYREDGLRASKTSAGSLRNFSWDEQNMAIATDGSFNLLECQTNAPGEWGSLSYQMQDGYFTIPLFDAQGSTRWELSWQGSSINFNQINYDAFGNLVSTPPAQPDPLKYIGQYGYYTDATGFVYVRNRYYDPVNGTWISRDPIGFGGGSWNTREYVGNEPVGRFDSNGLGPQFGIGYSWGREQLEKCRQPPHSAASCFDCAYGYVRDSLGTGNQSDYVICVRTNSYCHSHINCENGYGRGSFPQTPAPPLSCPLISGSIYSILGEEIGRTGGFPYGTILNPIGNCMEGCLKRAPMGMYFGFLRKTCKSLCHKIQAAGCNRLLQLCEDFDQEYYRLNLCMAFWSAAGCK